VGKNREPEGISKIDWMGQKIKIGEKEFGSEVRITYTQYF